MRLRNSRPAFARGALTILAVGLVGLLIALQGWRARGPDEDVMGAIVRAAALVERGQIPWRGTLTDHNSFRPPGASWLAVPGVVLFSDPRLVELAGSSVLYLGTLVGVFLIGRHFFGPTAGTLAVVAYGFSAISLDLASHLWLRGHPFFCVWMVYCAALWVDRRDGRWLAAACLLWAAGIYVHLEMTPVLLILPAIWWYYRPPIHIPALVAAAAVALLMWSPYLAFQRERGFIDLQSQLFLRPLEGRGIETVAVCGDDPLPNPQFRAATPLQWQSIAARVPAMADLALMNLETRVLGGEFILLALLTGGLVTAGARETQKQRFATAWPATRGPILLVAALIASSIFATEFTLRWIAAPESPLAAILLNARRFYVWLLIVVGVVIARDPRVARLAAEVRRSWRRGEDARVLVIAVVIPSIILLLLTEPGLNRMLGIWPLQVTLIAAFVVALTERLPKPSIQRWAMQATVILLIAANLELLSRVRDWQRNGWSGARPGVVEATTYPHVVCK